MSTELVRPLGALIVATRNNSGNETMHLADFNVAADGILSTLKGDLSAQADQLRRAIGAVRLAATGSGSRQDQVSVYEPVRYDLIAIRN